MSSKKTSSKAREQSGIRGGKQQISTAKRAPAEPASQWGRWRRRCVTPGATPAACASCRPAPSSLPLPAWRPPPLLHPTPPPPSGPLQPPGGATGQRDKRQQGHRAVTARRAVQPDAGARPTQCSCSPSSVSMFCCFMKLVMYSPSCFFSSRMLSDGWAACGGGMPIRSL